jgi:ABC-2 type transport system permease protein
MIRRTLSLIRKELTHIVRDPRTLVIMIVMPLVMLTILGYAGTTDVKHLRTAVYDGDKTPQSRELIDAYQASNYFDIVQYVTKEDDLAYLINRGDVRGALIVPAGYGRKMASGEPTDVAFLIDGSDPAVANTAFSASQLVGRSVSMQKIEQKFGLSVKTLPGVDVMPRVWYNPNLESANFMIPGLMAMILLMFTTLLTATAIVRERELGTIEQLIVTPIRAIELIIAKVTPYILVSFFIVVEILTGGVIMFGVPIKGSVPLLLGLSSLFLITALGQGILISTLARTQLEAFLMTFAIILPTVFLSGFFFPIEAMPGWLQVITYLVPARYAMVIMRGIILKGVGLEILREQVVAIIIFSVVLVVLAAARFKKKL